MKIGVDAGALSITDDRLKLGVYWVNVHLLRELGKLDKTNTYSLYSFSPIDSDLMKSFGPRMINRVLRPQQGWFSLRLPLELSVHPVDLFLGLSQAIPTSSAHAIGFIYDLGFLHNPSAYQGSQKKLVKITRDVVGRSDHIVTISEAVKKDIQTRFGVDKAKIGVAYPGVDETFTPKGEVYKGENPYFLFVGSLKPGKNLPRLIQAFAQFIRKEKKLYDLYLVGGEYWKDKSIDSEIVRLGIGPRIKKLGFVPDDTLASFYRGAVAFVSPSLYEGFCLPALESMACGCPVVGSTAGAMPEVVEDAGILVDPTDVSAIARALKTMAYNAKQRTVYSQKGIQRAKKYTWKNFAQPIYREIHEYQKLP